MLCHLFTAKVQEYCVSKEPFIASCLKKEVLIMTSATYGRMRMGRCLEDEGHQFHKAYENDTKFFGCSEDVLHMMDSKCSGRSQCEVRLAFDSEFEKLKPCNHALKLYLEASYQCITGELENYSVGL